MSRAEVADWAANSGAATVMEQISAADQELVRRGFAAMAAITAGAHAGRVQKLLNETADQAAEVVAVADRAAAVAAVPDEVAAGHWRRMVEEYRAAGEMCGRGCRANDPALIAEGSRRLGVAAEETRGVERALQRYL